MNGGRRHSTATNFPYDCVLIFYLLVVVRHVAHCSLLLVNCTYKVINNTALWKLTRIGEQNSGMANKRNKSNHQKRDLICLKIVC